MVEVVRYYTEEGHYIALVRKATKWLHVLMLDGSTLRPRRVSKDERRFMTPLTYRDKPYPKTRAARVFKRYAKARAGMNKAAKKILKELVAPK